MSALKEVLEEIIMVVPEELLQLVLRLAQTQLNILVEMEATEMMIMAAVAAVALLLIVLLEIMGVNGGDPNGGSGGTGTGNGGNGGNDSNNQRNGQNGSAPGGGGGGLANDNGSNVGTGGAGAAGQIIITWDVPANCSGNAISQTNTNVNNADRALGNPNNSGAELNETDDQLVLELTTGDLLTAGGTVNTRWQRTSGNNTTIRVEISANGTTWTTVADYTNISPEDTWITQFHSPIN